MGYLNVFASFASEKINVSDVANIERFLFSLERKMGYLAITIQFMVLAPTFIWIEFPLFPLKWENVWRVRQGYGIHLLLHSIMTLEFEKTLRHPDRPGNPRTVGLLLLRLVNSVSLFFYCFLDAPFTSLAFAHSINNISLVAWILYFFDATRKQILFYPKKNRTYMNVLVFDLFGKIICLSCIWYAELYDPAGTHKSKWIEYLG